MSAKHTRIVPPAGSPAGSSGGATARSTATNAPDIGPPGLLVVGIGASAGGLEALKDFFEAMPGESGMAFVVIQHLDPTHKSLMAEILAKHTAMPVVAATDGVAVQANTVYTLPTNQFIILEDGYLRLSQPTPAAGVKRPIDFFFRSLAQDRQERAIGIILSGSGGADGTAGVRAIRAAGGICLAQDPQTAQFAAMPQSAIDTGLVDFILAPKQMPAALLNYIRNPYLRPQPQEQDPQAPPIKDELEQVLEVIQRVTGGNFRQYRQSMVLRRLQRRMGLRQIESLADYIGCLRAQPREVRELANDLLIGVSSFFRDPEAFAEMEREVIAPLVARQETDEPIRVWVAGCATGEEAYSIAMMLEEELAQAGKNPLFQIFASDLDEDALQTARAGLYPESITEDVAPERLARYFRREGAQYRINKPLREKVIFARHNLISDPPFSRLDLISCRNVLIYFDPALQQRIHRLFSFSLKVNGYLFLGTSENLSGLSDSFETVSRTQRIYRLARPNRAAATEFSHALGPGRMAAGSDPAQALPAKELALLNQAVLLRHFGAAVVLVDGQGRVLHFFGRTEKYLGHAQGKASLNLLDMAAPPLASRLRRGLEKARHQDQPVTLAHVLVGESGDRFIDIAILAVPAAPPADQVLAVIFEDAPRSTAESPARTAEPEPLASQLEAELKDLRNEMAALVQEHAAADEEFKAATEEVLSMNEELQSTNEELETSKEELQSVNEELNTLNNQLNEKVTELTEAHNDISNLFEATQIATLFLDARLRVKRFTPGITELLNLLPTDVGRPLSDIQPNFAGDLAAEAGQVLRQAIPIEHEVQNRAGRWFTLRLLPYRTMEGRVDGVVATFTDVERLKASEQALFEAKTYAENIVQTVREALVVLDSQLRIVSANAAFYQLWHTDAVAAIGQRIYDLGSGQLDPGNLRKLLEEVIPGHAWLQDYELEGEWPGIGRRTLLLNARRIEGQGPETGLFLLALEDITEREADRAQLRKLAVQMTRSNTELEQFGFVISHDLQEPLRMVTLFLEILRKHLGSGLDEKAQEYITHVMDGAQRMQDMIKDLLDFSRLGKEDVPPVPVDLADSVNQALANLQSRIEQEGAKVTQDPLPTVQGDASQLARLFQNLIGNALKFRREKSPEIHIGATQNEQGWQFSVRDNGIGIDLKSADRIFQVFQRLHTRGKYEGTGIGLAICKRIVEQHGGRIWLESEVDKGTTFYFTLPRAREQTTQLP